MVAVINGFDSRSDVGLRAPRTVSYNITPQYGGATVHWGGPRQQLGSHNRCRQIWRSWQNFHMNSHGWADIAYTAAFCNHGYVLAGRGFGVRTAANGTNYGNQNYHAFVWIGGQGELPTQAAYNALDWLILEARNLGAGRRVRPHEAFTGSYCPGPQLKRHANSRDNHSIPILKTSPQVDKWEEFWMSLSDAQKRKLQFILDNVNAEALVDLLGKLGKGDRLWLHHFVRDARTTPERWTGQEIADAIASLRKHATITGNSSIQGVTMGGLNAFLYLNDQGAGLDTESRYGT